MKNSVVTTEMCSKYHPDKACDQISDAILTECLKADPKSRVACETLWKGNHIVLAGEITTNADVNYSDVAKSVAKELRYDVASVQNYISVQSPQIRDAVTKEDSDKAEIGAGDQGIMWGYACNDETTDYLPVGLWLSNRIVTALEGRVNEGILKGDAKVQVVAREAEIDEILISACHNDVVDIDTVREYITRILTEEVFNKDVIATPLEKVNLVINPSGLWTFGGPSADCGLTGRKIVCDSYGGYAPVGGGAYSGKDPSKVDRSGAYMARKIAVDMLREYSLMDCSVQLSYGIGLIEPRSVRVTGRKRGLFGRIKTIDISEDVKARYDLTPKGIIDALGLLTLDYKKIASGNHMKWFM